MPESQSPFEANPPSTARLMKSIGIALAIAVVALLAVVLPAEYGIDPTGIGRALGLTEMRAPTRTLLVKDVIGGNEKYREIKIPDTKQPIPLPNPAVIQLKQAAPRTDTITITLKPIEETEIKTVLDAAQVVLYDWKVEGGEVYTDFHGHEPGAGDAFVRYEEQMSGTEGHGSLVAPFAGEHGWYWVNVSPDPVTITLHLTGYYKDTKNYGILNR